MFDIGGWELLVIGALALIIVGPKDLPRMVRSVGQWVAKARGLAREFQAGMEEAARDADLKDLKDAAKMDVGVTKSLNEIDKQVRSIGADTKRAIENPYPSATSKTETAERRNGAGESGAAPGNHLSSRPSAPQPSSDAPAADSPATADATNGATPPSPGRAASAMPPPGVMDDSPPGAVSGPETEDDAAFLEKFGRSVRGNGE